jgi:hypothetical protein
MLTTIRVWAIKPEVQLNQADIEYCKNNNIRLDIKSGKTQEIEYAGRVFQFQGTLGYTMLTTVDDTGEAMLQLRYSDKVELLSRIMTDTMSI